MIKPKSDVDGEENLKTANEYVSALLGTMDQQNLKNVAISPIDSNKSIVLSEESDKEINNL